MTNLPAPIRAYLGLLDTAVSRVRDLSNRAPELPMEAVAAAMQLSLRAQQRFAELTVRGDEVLGRIRGVPEEAPSWATFDDEATDSEQTHTGLDDEATDRERMDAELTGEVRLPDASGRTDDNFGSDTDAESLSAGPLSDTFSARPLSDTFSAGPLSDTFSARPLSDTFGAGPLSEADKDAIVARAEEAISRRERSANRSTAGRPATGVGSASRTGDDGNGDETEGTAGAGERPAVPTRRGAARRGLSRRRSHLVATAGVTRIADESAAELTTDSPVDASSADQPATPSRRGRRAVAPGTAGGAARAAARVGQGPHAGSPADPGRPRARRRVATAGVTTPTKRPAASARGPKPSATTASPADGGTASPRVGARRVSPRGAESGSPDAITPAKAGRRAAKAIPVKGGAPRTRPTKAAPTKAGPTKIAPTKAAPTKTTPTKAAPTKGGPTKAATSNAATAAEAARTGTAATRRNSANAGPVKGASLRTGPVRGAPPRTGPIKSAPPRTGPVKSGPIKSGQSSADSSGGSPIDSSASSPSPAAPRPTRARGRAAGTALGGDNDRAAAAASPTVIRRAGALGDDLRVDTERQLSAFDLAEDPAPGTG